MGKLQEFFSPKKPQSVAARVNPPAGADIPKLQINFERQYIEINGITFELLKSDADIINDAFALLERSKKVDTTDQRAVLENLHEMAGYIDAILGDGALQKISGGVRVGYLKLQECTKAIVGAIYKVYQANLAMKYE